MVPLVGYGLLDHGGGPSSLEVVLCCLNARQKRRRICLGRVHHPGRQDQLGVEVVGLLAVEQGIFTQVGEQTVVDAIEDGHDRLDAVEHGRAQLELVFHLGKIDTRLLLGALQVGHVVVEEGAVLGANTTVSASVPIIDVTGSEPIAIRGRVPANAVIVPGTRPKEFPAGIYQLQTPLLIGYRSESTDRKTSLNDALRTFEVEV